MKIISASPQDAQTIHTNQKRLNLSKLEASFTGESPRYCCAIPLILSSDGVLIRQAQHFLSEKAYYGSGRDQSNTVRTYAECLYHWLQYLEGMDRDWGQATSRDLVRYRNSMKEGVSERTNRQLKSSTINLRMTVVVDFYRYLDEQASTIITTSHRNTSLTVNYRLGKSNYKLRKSLSRPRAMTQGVCVSLMRALGEVHRIIFAWSLTTGVSISSILGITTENYSPISAAGQYFIELMMKGGRMQKIYVPHPLRADTDR